MTFTLNIDEEIASLKRDIVKMASLCEKALYGVSSLVERGGKDIRDIQDLSDQVEKSQREIEQECMRILLRKHPVAKDLRSVSASLRIITDLERIGNNSLDLAEAITYCENREILQQIGLPKMIEEVSKMLTESIDALPPRKTGLYVFPSSIIIGGKRISFSSRKISSAMQWMFVCFTYSHSLVPLWAK